MSDANDELAYALRQRGLDPADFRLGEVRVNQFMDVKTMVTVTCGRTRVCRTYMSRQPLDWLAQFEADIRADVFVQTRSATQP